MAVVENADSSNRADSVAVDHSVSNHFSCNADPTFRSNDLTDLHVAVKNHQLQQSKKVSHYANGDAHGEGAAEQMKLVQLQQQNGPRSINGDGGVQKKNKGEESYDNNNNNEINDLQEMFSKLNPMAEEFVPPSIVKYKPLVHHTLPHFNYVAAADNNNLVMHTNSPGNSTRRKKNSYGHAKRRTSSRTSMAQREEIIKRTVYVSDIDQQVTEEQLAALFAGCGQVVDCRVCGDPNSVLRFAFIEFMDDEGANNALSKAGTMFGFYPVKVLPSKTAIAPVNPTLLPRSEDEREMCSRTIYCTNIDKKVTHTDVKLFFEAFCGEVYRLRLLGDYRHSTRIAFVEFVMAESAIAALNCSGAVMGSLPIRVSPSKTPVRPRVPRGTIQ